MGSNRLLIVSNRLPVTAVAESGSVQLMPAGGGLATGLRHWHEQSDAVWIGWPGELPGLTIEQRTWVDASLGQRRIVPVHLSPDHVNRYYHGFSSRVLRPLLHYLIDRVPVDARGWDAYCAANEVFADATAREYRPGDRIWVHDYQLMLLPGLLRERLPDAAIGFFLHIPFPSSEVFRTLPWRREILVGLLGSDLLGFNTFAYMRHFVTSLLHITGLEVDIDRVVIGDREVRLGVFPMGVDAAGWDRLAREPDVAAEVAAIKADAGDRQIVLGVDRLDCTKGIPRRLEAVEHLLARDPALADRMRFIQVALPSRADVDSSQPFRRRVEEMVGRINGAYGALGSTPVHYVHRTVPLRQLVALYGAADVMLVTPLRDGMNLVSKEFVASRVHDDGVLLLSEFAGASAELDGALVVNPYDVDGVADSLRRALSMPAAERRARMQRLRRRVREYDVHAWAKGFLQQLDSASPVRGRPAVTPPPSLGTVLVDMIGAPTRLLLDYDGTLVPFARSPGLAAPDEELLWLLDALATSPGLSVDIVSGRPKETLEAWLGHLPVALWAEHGFWHRGRTRSSWEPAAHVSHEWIGRVRPILEQFTTSTPGSHIEEKTASIAWHYRGVHREFGARQAHELRMLLGDALSNQPLEVLEGKKVIEVRLRGVSKALVARRVLAETLPGTRVVAIGDDRTDEDLFRALPPSTVTVAVGRRASPAHYGLDDYRCVRRVLRSLVGRPTAPATTGGDGASIVM